MKVTIKNDITPMTKKLAKQLDNISTDAYDYFVAQTPIAKINGGNARRNTDLDKPKDTIYADYDYAGRLDAGASRQAPKGMIEPTQRLIKREIDRIIKGK
jgi:hypothetical protein